MKSTWKLLSIAIASVLAIGMIVSFAVLAVRINNLEDKVERNVGAVDTDMTEEAEKAKAELKAAIAGANSLIDVLETSVATNTADIAKLRTDIAAAEARLDFLEDLMDTAVVDINISREDYGNSCYIVITYTLMNGESVTEKVFIPGSDEASVDISGVVDESSDKLTEDVTILEDKTGSCAILPSDTLINDGERVLTFTVVPLGENNPDGIAIESDESSAAFDIHVPQVSDANSSVIIVEIRTYIDAGLEGVQVYHEGAAMTAVGGVDKVDTAEEFYYDRMTGTLTFAATHFSKFTIVSSNANIKVGEQTYHTFAEALEAVEVGGAIQLIGHVVEDDTITIDKEVELDLGAYTVSGADTVFSVAEGGKLVLRGDGTVDGAIVNSGELNIISGAIDSVEGTGIISIMGGTFKAEPDKAHIAEGYCAVDNKNGTYTVRAHTPSEAAICTDYQACTNCGATLAEKSGHKDENKDHVCDNGCDVYQGMHADADDSNHECDYGCGRIADDGCFDTVVDGECDECGAVMAHECADKTGDSDHRCDICGKESITAHTYADGAYESNNTYHWQTCTECSAESAKAKHNHEGWMDSSTDPDKAIIPATCTDPEYEIIVEFCTVCGYEHFRSEDNLTGNPALGHTGGTATHTSQAICTRCNQPYGELLPRSYTECKHDEDER